MRRNNISNQTSVLDNVFRGFPNLFGSSNTGASRNTAQNGCESKAPIPNYYSPYTPITQTNLRNQSQNSNSCFHSESLLGSIFGGLKSRYPAPNYYSPYSPQTNIIYLSQTAIGSGELSKTNQETVSFHV